MVEQSAGTARSLRMDSLIAGSSMNRRKFCATSAAAAIAGAAGGFACLSAPAPAASSVQLYKFIYDRRYSAGRAFGTAAEHVRSAAGVAAIGGDITALWSRDLRLRWSAGGGTIAGLTTARTLLCLEQLARDHGMRVVIRAEHAISEGLWITHRLTASEPTIARLKSALVAKDWPAHMPAALTTWQGADRTTRITCAMNSMCRQRFTMTADSLVSFVIA
jgi:hypothetical protein